MTMLKVRIWYFERLHDEVECFLMYPEPIFSFQCRISWINLRSNDKVFHVSSIHFRIISKERHNYFSKQHYIYLMEWKKWGVNWYHYNIFLVILKEGNSSSKAYVLFCNWTNRESYSLHDLWAILSYQELPIKLFNKLTIIFIFSDSKTSKKFEYSINGAKLLKKSYITSCTWRTY